MANTYPLKPLAPTPYQGSSPSAATQQTERYKNMLGTQAASEDVGLFYQLNRTADELSEESKMQGQTLDGRFPQEANSTYA